MEPHPGPETTLSEQEGVRRSSEDASLEETTPDLEVIGDAPFNAETRRRALGPRLTRTSSFFVRTNFDIPPLASDTHEVRLEGMLARPQTLSLARLRTLGSKRLTVTLECAGNGRIAMAPLPPGEPWASGAASTAEWEGVPLSRALAEAGLSEEARYVVVEGADRGQVKGRKGTHPFARSLPREKALHPDTLLVWAMNGEPLPPIHGGPLRLLVPGWYGMASVKWVSRIEARAEPFDGYFQTERYIYDRGDGRAPEPVRDIQVRALILSPLEGAQLSQGTVEVSGRAWAGENSVARVEVAVDGGDTWAEARLLEPAQPYTWVRWAFTWRHPTPGRHTLRARATDSAGRVQPERVEWNRLGYGNNAVEVVRVSVVPE